MHFNHQWSKGRTKPISASKTEFSVKDLQALMAHFTFHFCETMWGTDGTPNDPYRCLIGNKYSRFDRKKPLPCLYNGFPLAVLLWLLLFWWCDWLADAGLILFFLLCAANNWNLIHSDFKSSEQSMVLSLSLVFAFTQGLHLSCSASLKVSEDRRSSAVIRQVGSKGAGAAHP